MKLNQVLHSRALRVVALLGMFSLLAIHLGIQSRQGLQAGTDATSAIPEEGVAENDTGGKVPGNPNLAIADFKQIYRFSQIYHKRNGVYPSHTGDLMSDIIQHPKDYGVSSFQDVKQFFLNPDDQFADSKSRRAMANKASTYILTNMRPDGTSVNVPKLPNQRDVLGYTNAYIHENIRTFSGQRTTANPVGYYLVLWDDGQVQRVPYDRELFVPLGKGKFATAFPGQAGVPANAKTYDEFYRLTGWRKGPRGKEGGKGVSYSGKSYR